MNEINSQVKINIPIKKNSNNVYSKKLQGKVVYSDNKLNIVNAGGKLYILDSNGKKLPEGSIVNLLFNTSNDLKELKNAIFTKALGNLTNNTLHIEIFKNLSFNIDISNIPNIQKSKLLMWISEFSESLKENFSKNNLENTNIEKLLENITPEKQKQVKGFIRSIIDEFSKSFLKSKLVHPSPNFIAKKVEQIIKNFISPKKEINKNSLNNNSLNTELLKKDTSKENNNTSLNKKNILENDNNEGIIKNKKLNKNLEKNILKNDDNSKQQINKKNTFEFTESKKQKIETFNEGKKILKEEINKTGKNIFKNNNIISNKDTKETKTNEYQKQNNIVLEKNKNNQNIFKKNIQQINNQNTNNQSIKTVNKSIINEKNILKNKNQLNEKIQDNKFLNINKKSNEEISKISIKENNIKKLKRLIRLPSFKKYKSIINKKNINLKKIIPHKNTTLVKNSKKYIIQKNVKFKKIINKQSSKNQSSKKKYIKQKLIQKNKIKIKNQKITTLKDKNFKLNLEQHLKKQNIVKTNTLKQKIFKNDSINERLNFEQVKKKDEEQVQTLFKKNILTLNKTMEKAVSAYKTMENSKNINDTSYMMFNMLGVPVFMSFKKGNEIHNNKENSSNYGKLRLVLPTETFGITDINMYISEKDVILKIGLDKNEEIFKSDLDKLSTNIEKLGYKLNSLNIYKNEKDITVKENIF
ncbi:hypothetical protein OSSY52_11610 [Tepiditoga spiralis]|uniref:Uncharacterized protein n=1 Tax=Tepiditoga spiralis TaxID=2108365 RepID=A0A7G1G3L7_9BACT|nr:hypothetical protein [Tepiditoga spiralis]BBE31020.1 hypothetical protein OSSY52_11610 [Tepiditoga spiralis]